MLAWWERQGQRQNVSSDYSCNEDKITVIKTSYGFRAVEAPFITFLFDGILNVSGYPDLSPQFRFERSRRMTARH